jgi:penicillin-binding protein 1A
MSLLWRILKKVFSSLFLAAVTLVGAPVAFALTVFAGLIFLPLPATIPIPKASPVIEPTIIYDRYGHQIATLQKNDRSIPVTEADIPQVLKEAVISDEDRNFYKHGGVDLRGTLRALWSDIRNKGPLQGGSTITQQYVKLAYTGAQRSIYRKVREAILASQLDRQASKDEILYRYLTIVYFGDGNYGIGAAAQNYFHTSVNHLNASQAATLAGLIPAPSARAPRENLDGAEEGRQLVLGKMRQQGYLTEVQYRQALTEHLALAASGTAPPGATLIYPRPTAATAYPDFVDYVTRWLQAYYPASEIYGGGLRVQTTLDPRIQDAAYASVRTTLAGTADPLEMALASVEPQTGFVEALVSGRRYIVDSYNLTLGGCTPKKAAAQVQVPATCWDGSSIAASTGGAGRQPGSAWKPFVLAAAFEAGIPPSTAYPAPGVYQIPNCKPPAGQPASACQIHNDEPGSRIGSETLAQATAASTNTVYAQVAAQVTCPKVASVAKALGIESAYYATPPFYYCPSYALGEIDVSPLDMASAYGVFAAHGQKAQPTPILEIVDGSGRVLVDNIRRAPAAASVMPGNVADNVTNVLNGVITSGTGTAAALGRPAAGKTGTTSDYTNAWFVGYTPTLSTAVWMGNAKSQSTPMGSVKGIEPVYGGTWPARTWRDFMLQALAGVPATPFTQPAPITPPAPVAVLSQRTTTTTTRPPVLPGYPSPAQGTPIGGPYQDTSPSVYAPAPVTTTTTVPTTTTVSAPTTSTTLSGGPGSGPPGATTTTSPTRPRSAP